jgi:D-tyrosyl-tRNA(Tyr) deacylase
MMRTAPILSSIPCIRGPETDLRALVQRVSQVAVDVESERVAQIGAGMLVLLGVRRGDTADDADRLAAKVRALRIFDDAEGRMDEPLGPEREILCVSQFTLYGDTRRGTRPSYIGAARPEDAEPLYDRFCERTGAKKGVFGACMGVALINDGPVTVMVEVEP